jgi:hypothetical protein
MTAMDEPVSVTALTLAATLTVEQHQAQPRQSYAPGTCRQCTPQGCPQLDWAQRTLAELRNQAQAQAPS